MSVPLNKRSLSYSSSNIVCRRNSSQRGETLCSMRSSASGTRTYIATFWFLALLELFLVVVGETQFDEADFVPLMLMDASHNHFQNEASSPRVLEQTGEFVDVNRIAIDDTGKEIEKGKGSFHIGGVEGKVIPGEKHRVPNPALKGSQKDKEGHQGGGRGGGGGKGQGGGNRGQEVQHGGSKFDGGQRGSGGFLEPGGKGDSRPKDGSKNGGIVNDGAGRDPNTGGTGKVPPDGIKVPTEESKKEVGTRTERDEGQGRENDKQELGNTIVIPGTGGNIFLTDGGVLEGDNLPKEDKNILNSLLPEIGKKPEGCIIFGDVKPGNLTCYSCKVDFRKTGYDRNNPCLGRHGNEVDKKYLVRCGSEDIFCRVERNEVNGIMIQLTRECTDICYYGCRPKGFGISNEACSKCCNSDGCNNMYPESGAPSHPNITCSVVLLLLIVLLDSRRFS